jgi:16S rRNA processing protein RimM
MAISPYLEIGKIINTHGVRGEVKLEPWADSPEALLPLKTLWRDAEPLAVERSRVHGKFVIVKFRDVDTVEAAMALKGRVVRAERRELPLPEGRYFLQDMLGLPVWEEDGTVLGTLIDVLDYPAGRVFVVRGETEHLIPEKGGFFRSLDPSLGHLTVHLLEGM